MSAQMQHNFLFTGWNIWEGSPSMQKGGSGSVVLHCKRWIGLERPTPCRHQLADCLGQHWKAYVPISSISGIITSLRHHKPKSGLWSAHVLIRGSKSSGTPAFGAKSWFLEHHHAVWQVGIVIPKHSNPPVFSASNHLPTRVPTG